jgi:hypothetical protein
VDLCCCSIMVGNAAEPRAYGELRLSSRCCPDNSSRACPYQLLGRWGSYASRSRPPPIILHLSLATRFVSNGSQLWRGCGPQSSTFICTWPINPSIGTRRWSLLSPKVNAASTVASYRAALQAMLNALHDPATQVIAPLIRFSRASSPLHPGYVILIYSGPPLPSAAASGRVSHVVLNTRAFRDELKPVLGVARALWVEAITKLVFSGLTNSHSSATRMRGLPAAERASPPGLQFRSKGFTALPGSC